MTVNLEPIANMLRGEAKLRTHSGKVLPGDVFVALSGLRTDGARFIDEAVSRGAAAVVHARKARISRREGVVYAAVDNPARKSTYCGLTAIGNGVPHKTTDRKSVV